MKSSDRMDCTLKRMSDWDAARYHRISDPQRSWGLRVLERLQPQPGERILDVGCGTGRLMSEILERQPPARVIGVDQSRTMLMQARKHLQDGGRVVQGDAAALPFAAVFDAVFSTATFHWVRNHDRLFGELHRVLRPGGRLVAQAGGGANLAKLRERSNALGSRDRQFAPYFATWEEPWHYASVEDTEARLACAGFVDAQVWLEPAPTHFSDAEHYAEFVACVCLRRQLDRLPPGKRDGYVGRITELAAADDPPFTLDYWRLNIDARKR